MLSFRIQGGNSAANRFCEATRIFTLAESLGGVESLIEVPASMTHMGIPKEQREAAGVFDDLVRISCGVEVRFFSFFPSFLVSYFLIVYLTDILSFFLTGLRRSRRRHFTSFGKSRFYFYKWNFFFYDLVPTHQGRNSTRPINININITTPELKRKPVQIPIEMMIKST